jgi:N-acetylglutamate synthase/N-acetylornithine aminotransferase
MIALMWETDDNVRCYKVFDYGQSLTKRIKEEIVTFCSKLINEIVEDGEKLNKLIVINEMSLEGGVEWQLDQVG